MSDPGQVRAEKGDGKMMVKRNSIMCAIPVIACVLLFHGCEKINDIKERATDTIDSSTLMDEVERIYDKAKSIGEEVPNNVKDWAVLDVKKLGDWEYKNVTVESVDTANIEKTLNELGSGRWECFWVTERQGKVELLLKRPARSYLKHLPLRDLLRILPEGQAP